MKKLILITLVCISVNSYGQMDNLSNLSAEWMRTGARNAATNATDAAVYNPAGLTHLESGLHINFSNQSLFRKPSHSYDMGLGEGVKTFTQDGSDPFIPELYLSYNKNKFAFFGGAFISGGGATMNYPGGSISTDMIAMQALMGAGGAYMSANQNLEATSMYMTYMGGVAYAASKMISFSIAVRDISAKNTVNGGVTLTNSPFDLPDMPLAVEYNEKANGIGAVVGLNVSLGEKINIAARYESKVSLDFKTEMIKDDMGMITDGEKNPRDMPAVAAIGASIKANDMFRAYFDYNYYFQEDADWGKSTYSNEELSSLAGNAYCIGAGLECTLSEKFMASFGGGVTKFMYNNKDEYYTHMGTFEVMQDNNTNINLGFAYQPLKMIRFNAGYMHTFWSQDQTVKALLVEPLDVDVTINNSLNAIAIGVELAF